MQNSQPRLSPELRPRPITMEYLPERPVLLCNNKVINVCRQSPNYHTGSDQSSVTSKLRDSARTATCTKWYDSNLLAGNLEKYQTMNIGYSQDNISEMHTISVSNEEIKTVENLKHLAG